VILRVHVLVSHPRLSFVLCSLSVDSESVGEDEEKEEKENTSDEVEAHEEILRSPIIAIHGMHCSEQASPSTTALYMRKKTLWRRKRLRLRRLRTIRGRLAVKKARYPRLILGSRLTDRIWDWTKADCRPELAWRWRFFSVAKTLVIKERYVDAESARRRVWERQAAERDVTDRVALFMAPPLSSSSLIN
jgi:hypothetical protein